MLAVGCRLANVHRTKSIVAVSLKKFFTRNLTLSPQRNHNLEGGGTTVTVLNSEPDAPLMIDSYSQFGFRLNNGLSVFGPMVIFPKTILSWNVGGVEDITEESLSLFFVLEPKLDILVIGLGERGNKIDPRVVTSLRRYGTNVEVLTTDAACSTFNFLNAEERSVAGALLPPRFVTVTDNDVIESKIRRNELFQLKEGSE